MVKKYNFQTNKKIIFNNLMKNRTNEIENFEETDTIKLDKFSCFLENSKNHDI